MPKDEDFRLFVVLFVQAQIAGVLNAIERDRGLQGDSRDTFGRVGRNGFAVHDDARNHVFRRRTQSQSAVSFYYGYVRKRHGQKKG